MFERLLSRGKVRSASRRLTKEPTARNYVLLAQAHAAAGRLDEVRKVCEEGLQVHAGSAELARLLDRTRALERQDRTRELQAALRESPRPALFRELCEIQIEAGQVSKAEQTAARWFELTKDGEAQLLRARARVERFFADRRREDGLLAFELTDDAVARLAGDPRPLRLRLTLASRAGAWQEARATVARLLELYPGDTALEARFRTVHALAEKGKSLDRALMDIERSGNLADEVDDEESRQPTAKTVRPLLQEIAAEDVVRGAFYVRGGTALVQGPKGATAERTARGVREIMSASRTVARRLGLGQSRELRFEGDFGSLLAYTGESGAAAVWTSEPPTRRHLEAVQELAAAAGQRLEGD